LLRAGAQVFYGLKDGFILEIFKAGIIIDACGNQRQKNQRRTSK